MTSLIFRKGLGLKEEVAGQLADDYHSRLVDEIRSSAYQYTAGRLTVRLAREFGFCYGVDRAVDYAYQTRRRYPDRPVYLTSEIVHNPHVNERLRAADVRFLSDPGEDPGRLRSDAVVIVPAFGVSAAELDRYLHLGCTVVDTTCGSVLNVWNRVRQYAADGFTAIIHGKVHHEETRATASQALTVPGGRYLVVLDRSEALEVCDYIRTGGATAFQSRFEDAASPEFNPDRDLQRIGLANQTTMLMSESLEIGELLRQAVVDRYGAGELYRHYRAFDTICSATQDRQDAARALVEEGRLDLVFVIGGYNSSNTRNLARICAERVPTFHVADAACLVSRIVLRHQPIGSRQAPADLAEVFDRGWLPESGALAVGLTTGASTPDSVLGHVIDRLADLAAA